MLRLISSLLLFAGIANSSPRPTELRREDLMAALRKGGYTILLRHARTNQSFTEVRSPVPIERSAQRNLTDEGVRDAKLMGLVFKKYRIPIGEIISSPMFRSIETAEYAAGTPTTITMVLRTFPSTPEQAALVAAAPKPGTNRLLVTHHFVIEAHVPGISPGDIGESEAAIIRTTADGHVELVGRITLSDWASLAGTGQPRPLANQTPASESGNLVAARGVSSYSEAGAGKAVEMPDTPAGRLSSGYVAAFNSGNPARMRAFIESYMVVNPERPIDARIESYQKLFEQFGPLSLEEVVSSEPGAVTVRMRSKGGSLRVTVKASDSQPGRAASVSFSIPEARGHD